VPDTSFWLWSVCQLVFRRISDLFLGSFVTVVVLVMMTWLLPFCSSILWRIFGVLLFCNTHTNRPEWPWDKWSGVSIIHKGTDEWGFVDGPDGSVSRYSEDKRSLIALRERVLSHEKGCNDYWHFFYTGDNEIKSVYNSERTCLSKQRVRLMFFWPHTYSSVKAMNVWAKSLSMSSFLSIHSACWCVFIVHVSV
jgi:hypothetical protein